MSPRASRRLPQEAPQGKPCVAGFSFWTGLFSIGTWACSLAMPMTLKHLTFQIPAKLKLLQRKP